MTSAVTRVTAAASAAAPSNGQYPVTSVATRAPTTMTVMHPWTVLTPLTIGRIDIGYLLIGRPPARQPAVGRRVSQHVEHFCGDELGAVQRDGVYFQARSVQPGIGDGGGRVHAVPPKILGRA